MAVRADTAAAQDGLTPQLIYRSLAANARRGNNAPPISPISLKVVKRNSTRFSASTRDQWPFGREAAGGAAGEERPIGRRRDYIRRKVTAHQETAQLFEYEIGTGQDSQLKTFASQALPVLMEPRYAQTIDTRLAGGAKR